jgi:hypothetical protein
MIRLKLFTGNVRVAPCCPDVGPILTDSYYWIRGVPEEYVAAFEKGYKVFIPYVKDKNPTLVITDAQVDYCRARAATQEDLELLFEYLD